MSFYSQCLPAAQPSGLLDCPYGQGCFNQPHAHHPCLAFHPYLIAPLQAVAVKANGQQSPPSAEDIFITPSLRLGPGSLAGPTLTSAKPWGPTTAQAIATAPVGVTFSQVSGGSIIRSKINDKIQPPYPRLLSSISLPISLTMPHTFMLVLQYKFIATPVAGGQAVEVTGIAPDVRFRDLEPNTEASGVPLV